MVGGKDGFALGVIVLCGGCQRKSGWEGFVVCGRERIDLSNKVSFGSSEDVLELLEGADIFDEAPKNDWSQIKF